MKTLIITLSIAVCTILGTAAKNVLPAKADSGTSEGFAVVELFTSEGCSSCPPADELIARVQKEYGNKPVYILAYHVDYWNRLGWKDVFSDHAFSVRQNKYAGWLKADQVYTPQAIVNGQTEFVGSEEEALRNTLSKALGQPGSDHIALSDIKAGDKTVMVNYATAGKRDVQLVIALVQKHAVTAVKRGENSGRTLSHVQIVRTLKTLDAAKSGTISLAVPAAANGEALEVIAFLQDPASGAITGAAKLGVPQQDRVAKTLSYK